MIWQILLCIFIWLLVSRWRRRDIIKLSKKLKAPFRSLPLVGHAYGALGSGEDIMNTLQIIGKKAIEYGGLTYSCLGNQFFIIVADPEIIDLISKKCLEKHYVMSLLELLLGNGSIIAPEQIWRRRRKTIVPTFRQQNLNQFVNKVYSLQSKIMVERLQEIDKDEIISIWNYINNYTFDSVIEAITGVRMNVQLDSDQPFIKAFENCSKLFATRVFRPWLHYSTVYKLLPAYKTWKDNVTILCNFIDKIVQSTRIQMEIERQNKLKLNLDYIVGTQIFKDRLGNNAGADKNRLKPILEHLLGTSDNTQMLTDLECREEMLVMAMAATDTSAVGASFTAVMLSRHPDVQEKAYKEVLEVFGQSDRPVEAADLPRLKYLEAVIKETLRLYPPVPVVVRNIEDDIPLPSGLTLVKGIGACFHIWAVHRNPKYWGEDAEVFKPERFLDTPLKHPAAFIPFSFGPRNCPGNRYALMSMTTLMATILRRYQLLPATPTGGDTTSNNLHSNHKPLRLKFDVMMKDVDGFKVKIRPRL